MKFASSSYSPHPRLHYSAAAKFQLTTGHDQQRDHTGAAARASGKAKGRRDHNNTFPRRRVSEGRAPGSSNNNNDDDLFAHPFPHQSLGNFYYPPLALHSYQNNVSVFGLPGYAGCYILNQPYPAPVPQYYPSAQPVAWENCDFGVFDRVQVAGPQQVSWIPACMLFPSAVLYLGKLSLF